MRVVRGVADGCSVQRCGEGSEGSGECTQAAQSVHRVHSVRSVLSVSCPCRLSPLSRDHRCRHGCHHRVCARTIHTQVFPQAEAALLETELHQPFAAQRARGGDRHCVPQLSCERARRTLYANRASGDPGSPLPPPFAYIEGSSRGTCCTGGFSNGTAGPRLRAACTPPCSSRLSPTPGACASIPPPDSAC